MKKKLVTLMFAGEPDSAMSFEVKERKPIKTIKLRPKEVNLAAITYRSSNLETPENQRLYRKESAYISR